MQLPCTGWPFAQFSAASLLLVVLEDVTAKVALDLLV
jgi:hypothetical protein